VAFTLRDARAGDLKTLWQIDQECFAEGLSYSEEELEFFMTRRGSFTLVAMDDENHQIRGFIVGHAGAVGHIITIDVVASARRSGLGSLLLGAAEDRIRAAGKRTMTLETSVDNRAALSFYKRHGFEIAGTIAEYYADGTDAFFLRKSLASAR
jgi:ribosomal-protein-alanine N-acetyltransferase